MRRPHVTIGLLALWATATSAWADYDSHPSLHPSQRCIDEAGARFDRQASDPHPSIGPTHCQRLVWDLEATAAIGAIRIGAPFDEDPEPRFPHGVVDRPPPLYVFAPDHDPATGLPPVGLDCDPDHDPVYASHPECGDGVPDGFERPGPGRVRICQEGEVPYWKAHRTTDGSAVIAEDLTGRFHDVDDPSKLQSGPKFELACHRGTRAYYGPYQIGRGQEYDFVAPEQMLRFDNSDQLDRDQTARLLPLRDPDGDPDDGANVMRVEWNVGIEFYNSYGSHHAQCYRPRSPESCDDPYDPAPRGAHHAGGACWDGYQEHAEPGASCDAGDIRPECDEGPGKEGTRAFTQVPGRVEIRHPDDRGEATVERQIWMCNHHVERELPPGIYGLTEHADYRLQRGGLVNDTNAEIFGVPPGEVIGGAVGEFIVQGLSDSWLSLDPTTGERRRAREPIHWLQTNLQDIVTTFYPPFTWNYHTVLWFPPYDAALTSAYLHSHHRMVKGTMSILPTHPTRPRSPNPDCGGSLHGPAPDLYVNWLSEDARVCDYWKEPDGPVVIRKGQALVITCTVNNGVTPEAIKHGLVASSVVESLRVLGAPIPEYPELVAASAWGGILEESPVGDQLLYGQHPPINYRVVYKCGRGVAPGDGVVQAPLGLAATEVCRPNPMTDGDGDYVDGPYENDVECGEGGICEPSTIVFRCVGEDEMCFGLAAYYPLPRLLGPGHDEAMDNLERGNLDRVGLPGAHRQAEFGNDCFDCPETIGP